MFGAIALAAVSIDLTCGARARHEVGGCKQAALLPSTQTPAHAEAGERAPPEGGEGMPWRFGRRGVRRTFVMKAQPRLKTSDIAPLSLLVSQGTAESTSVDRKFGCSFRLHAH